MITEIAQIDAKPCTEKDFETAVAKARVRCSYAPRAAWVLNFAQVGREAVTLSAAGQMGDAGKSHRRFQGIGRFHGVARAGRAVFCRAARGRTYRRRY